MTEIRHIRRIAMLSVHTCPAATPGGFKTGGMNVYVRALSQELARRNIQVDIFTRWQDSCQFHENPLFDQAHNVRLIHIPAGPGESVEPDRLVPFLDDFTRGVESFATENSVFYDVIYAHYWLSGLVGLVLRAAWNSAPPIPLVQMFHTLGIMKDRVDGKLQVVSSPRNLAEAELMAHVDRVIAATPAEYEQLIRLYDAPRDKVRIVPPGVDTERFHPGDQRAAKVSIGFSPDDHLLLFVGRPEPLKAIDTIFAALWQLFDAEPILRKSVTLLLIGGQPNESMVQSLRTQVGVMGIDDNVRFLAAQTQDTLPQYYVAADGLLMPSDYESFGMVALEALASGTPVVASQVGGLGYLVRDGESGYHVPTRDPAALADAIKRLLTQPEIRMQMALNAVKSAQQYDWGHIADRLLAIFEAC